MDPSTIRQKFTAAVDALVEQIRKDRSVLAVILCGSLSHDTVWARSDVDLVLVTADDKLVTPPGVALYADGVNVHAFMMQRTPFRKLAEGSLRNSFVHSFLTKGRLLYAHDPSIAALCATLSEMGERDRRIQLLDAATGALPPIDKAHKWMVTRGDLEYSALWILYAATPLAKVEAISAGQLVDREVIPQALRLNPAFFTTIYTDLLNTRKTRDRVQRALDAVDGYIAERAPLLFEPLLDHLREVGDARSCTELEDHFKRHFDVEGVTIACEYLADHGLLGKASTPVRLTKKSNIDVQELAFFYTGAASHGR